MKKITLILILTLLLSSCNLPQPAPEEDLIGTIAAATLTALPLEDELPTATDGAQATADATQKILTTETLVASIEPTGTASPTQTETPTEEPTETSSPTPVPDDPAENLGVPTFLDTFSNANNWYTYDEPQSSFEIDEGVFTLTAKKANSYETWSLSWAEIKNFYLEVTGTFGEECSGKDRYGVIFRAPDTGKGYLLSVTCDGNFRLSSWDGDEYRVIKKYQSSGYLETGPGATNRLGIKAKDSKLKVYVNGHQVLNINDNQFTGKGRFGVLVAASETAGFSANLSRVRYWKLP